MKKLFLVFLLTFSACRNTVSGPTVLSPSPIASPLPAISPDPNATFVLISISAKPLGSGGASTSSFVVGQEYVLHGDLEAFDSTGKRILAPPIAFWAWGDFSDPQSHCSVFGEVNSSHPHGQCNAAGLFVVQATAFGFDGKVIGISILYTAYVF